MRRHKDLLSYFPEENRNNFIYSTTRINESDEYTFSYFYNVTFVKAISLTNVIITDQISMDLYVVPTQCHIHIVQISMLLFTGLCLKIATVIFYTSNEKYAFKHDPYWQNLRANWNNIRQNIHLNMTF